jgi:hypothetical protein
MNIYIRSDNTITLTGLKDSVTDTFIVSGATVRGQIFAGDDEILPGINFSYITASEGDYVAEVSDALNIFEKIGIQYVLQIVVEYLGKTTTFRQNLEPVYKNIGV